MTWAWWGGAIGALAGVALGLSVPDVMTSVLSAVVLGLAGAALGWVAGRLRPRR